MDFLQKSCSVLRDRKRTQDPVAIAKWTHLNSSRTQKLSTFTATIVGLAPAKIASCRVLFFCLFFISAYNIKVRKEDIMKNLGFYNGKIDELENMQVPMLDRACYFGDGVYDVSYANNHTIFALQDHLNRFYNSARLLNIKIPYEKEELQDLLISLVKKVDSPTQFVYWQVSRGTCIRNHIYSDDMVGNLWVMITPKALTNPNKEMSVVTMEDTRFFHNNIKTINLIPAVMYSTDAHNHGYDECILHRGKDRVTECAHSNVSILKDGVFITAPCDEYILPGIARKHLLEACRALNVHYEEKVYSLQELLDADEIIVSSSTHICKRVNKINNKPCGGKDLNTFKKLQDYVFNEFYDYTNANRID